MFCVGLAAPPISFRNPSSLVLHLLLLNPSREREREREATYPMSGAYSKDENKIK